MSTQPPRAIELPISGTGIFMGGVNALGRGLYSGGRYLARNSPFGQMMEPEPVDEVLPSVTPTPGARNIDQPVRPLDALTIPAVEATAVAPPPAGAGATMRSIERNAYRAAPEWSSTFDGATSAGQMIQDAQARDLINARHAQAMEGITAAEEARGNPQRRAIDARRLTSAYERSLPEGSTGTVAATYGSTGWGGSAGTEVPSPGTGERQLGRYTIGEAQEQREKRERAIERLDPQREMEAALAGDRRALAQQLQYYATELADRVASKEITAADAQKRYADAEKKAAIMAGITSGRDLSGFYRNDLTEAISGTDTER